MPIGQIQVEVLEAAVQALVRVLELVVVVVLAPGQVWVRVMVPESVPELVQE